MSRLVLSGAFVVLVACSGKTTGADYRGEPLFTLAGQLELRGSRIPTNPIHLAVAWYPDQRSAAAPKAIVPQDVEYQGTFPLNYTFSFYGLPPAGAVQPSTSNGHTVGSAWGVLIAYEDLNGNGQLDSIAQGGSPIDRVLGTSVGDVYNGNASADQVYVAYLDDTPPPEWEGYSAGYNLWRSGKVVPASTPVTLPLDDTNELSLFVCDEFLSGRSGDEGLPCNIPPTGGVRILGSVYASDGVPVASFSITDGVNQVLGALVEVNGTTVPYVPSLQGYELDGAPLSVNTPGVNEVRVTLDGGVARVFRPIAPGDFSLVAPANGAHVLVGAPITLQWTAASGANFFQAGGYAATSPYATDGEELIYSSTGRLSSTLAMRTDDYHRVYVTAYDRAYVARGLGGSVVTSATTRQVTLDAISADAGVRVEGSLSQLLYQGTLQDNAYISLFDGIVDARGTVTVNGQTAALDPMYQLYSLQTSGLFSPGLPAEIVATVPGHAAITRSASFPGALNVTPPPATASSTQPLALHWAASENASVYRYWVSDVQGRQVFYAETLDTHGLVPALHLSGDFVVSVSAVRFGADRHLEAYLQAAYDVHFDP